MNSDIKSVRVTGTGSALASRARICGVKFTSDGVGAGRLTITDGNGGDTALDLDFLNSDQDYVQISGNGILVQDAIWVSAITNAVAVTLFYEG